MIQFLAQYNSTCMLLTFGLLLCWLAFRFLVTFGSSSVTSMLTSSSSSSDINSAFFFSVSSFAPTIISYYCMLWTLSLYINQLTNCNHLCSIGLWAAKSNFSHYSWYYIRRWGYNSLADRENRHRQAFLVDPFYCHPILCNNTSDDKTTSTKVHQAYVVHSLLLPLLSFESWWEDLNTRTRSAGSAGYTRTIAISEEFSQYWSRYLSSVGDL